LATKGPLIQRLLRRIVYKYYARNLLFELQMRARADSADYVEAHMAEAILFEDHDAFLRFCLERSADGAALEFGVAGGRSIGVLARVSAPRLVHGFDSFEGLPEDWTGHMERRGAFSQKGVLPRVPDNVRLYKGWFSDSLPPWLAQNAGPTGFIHVDCDIYASTRDVLWVLRERMVVGTVIVFDEYFNYPNWRLHEARALKEFVAEFGVTYRYIAFTALDGAVAIEITGLESA
jgi:hypothetical protein